VGPVRKYKVNHNGYETVLKLSDEDAKAYPDAQPVDEPAPQGAGDAKQASSKTRSAADKSRRAGGDKSNA